MTARHAVFLALTLVLSAGVLAADIDLPMIQINHDDDDEYPDLQEQVHLEDFFWTGSGDGPPDYVKKIHTGISQGKDVIVKTNTVVATVYVEGHNEVDIPICLDCFPDNTVGLPLNFSSTDRRYWLLTVISGFYTAKDIPMLEEKLAKLYRLAFTRQQSKHLGIGNGSSTSGASVSFPDSQPDPQYGVIEEDEPDDSEDFEDYHEIKRRRRRKRRRRELPPQNHPQHQQSSELEGSSEQESLEQDQQEVSDPSTETDSTIEQPQLAYELLNPQNNKGELLLRHHHPPRPVGGGDGGGGTNLPAGLNPQAIFTDDQVRIVIHNVTQITEKDIQSGGLPSVTGPGHDEGDVNTKIEERPLANQTEIIYSVLVGGRPVLAVTASNDMKLVSEQEVTSVMGKEIFMKAEPYLKEPQATPLAPATRSSDSGFIASLEHNPLLIVIGSIVILLLLLLLIALLLMGRPRRDSKSEVKRASSRNELLAEGRSPSHGHQTIHTVEEITAISRRSITDGGVQNFGFETETVHASIAGPQQPATRSRRDSTTSSDNTSDSSIYCPINPPPADVQRMLDEKAASLFDKRKRRQQHADTQEAIYTSVISERKKDKKHSSTAKHKTKRRYLSENRVGSIEEVPTHSSTETTASNESIAEALQPNYENLERTEAFNPHNNYNRNKLLHSRTFTDKVYDSVPDEMPTQAINREIIRALQPSEKSSETGSIGSFLSMASVKSFPKQSHPEPLNRVLEPVFVTYYDNAAEDTPKPTRKHHHHKTPLSEAMASIERFPEPKAPRSMRASQSDTPDPGVVGPIVWEIHKKRLAENDDQGFDATRLTPIRDPAETRSHFQGLLEGALQMYSSQDDLPTPLPTKNFTNQRKRTSREFRGKSAGSSDQPKSSTGQRPSTAQPDKTPASSGSTQPPSPNMGAWGSGGIHQPLVRPLSAGPFHRPDPPPSIDVTRVLASQSANREELSAAPLIEAIQNELKKFKRDA